MRQPIEQTEHDIQRLESQVEQVQSTLRQIGDQLQRIADAVTRLENRGDRQTSEALHTNLREKQEREQDAYHEVSQLRDELEGIQIQLGKMQTENDKSRNEIEALTRVGEDVGPALEEVSERDVLLQTQEQQIQALRAKLGGFGPADTSSYEPRVVAPLSERVRWIDEGIHQVPVHELPPPEGITSAADFQKVSETEMRAGIRRLQEMRPTIEAGAGASSDYWREFDKTHGLEYAHGYQRVYDAFFGMDAIKVTADGKKYDIVNGRHRIWLAQQMGIDYLPMRVSRKFEVHNS